MRVPTGVDELDGILEGGLLAGRNYLVRGGPGTGKTTLALHFATEEAEDEPVLFVSLSYPEDELRDDAARVGLNTKHVDVLDLSSPTDLPEDFGVETEGHLARADEGRIPIVRAVLASVRQLGSRRVVIDSMTRLRELIPDVEDFRREVLALLRALNETGATVMGTSESTATTPDDELQFLVDGVVTLEVSTGHRTLRVTKFRGSGFQQGAHTFRLTDAGMVVFPRLVPGSHSQTFTGDRLSFGVPEINQLLSGGLERGTMTLISGPSGVGKTTLGAQFMKEAAGRGERSVVFMFEEMPATFIHRCEAVTIPVRAMMERGTLELIPVEPLAVSPDEIAAIVRTEVEERGATVVMLDSVASYRLSMAGQGAEHWVQLHTLGRYLKNMGVTGLLIDEIAHVTGNFVVSEHGLSYLADTVLFLRHLEVDGELRKVIGVLKKRMSDYENVLRELQITENGLKVGAPLHNLRGVLSGIPEVMRSNDDSGAGGSAQGRGVI